MPMSSRYGTPVLGSCRCVVVSPRTIGAGGLPTPPGCTCRAVFDRLDPGELALGVGFGLGFGAWHGASTFKTHDTMKVSSVHGPLFGRLSVPCAINASTSAFSASVPYL